MTTTESATTAQHTLPTRVTDPTQIHGAFMAATNAKDLDALAALYDPAGLAVELDGSEVRGSTAMREMFVGLTTAIAHIDGATRKVFVVGDIALTSGSWTAQIELPDGSVIEQTGTTAEVSVRQPDGTWLLLIDDPLFA